MTESIVVAFRPYVVEVDVSLELYLMPLSATLRFGPFDTATAAEKWKDVLEREHKMIELREEHEDQEALKKIGVPTQPFLRARIQGTDIVQPKARARKKWALIAPGEPVVDAHQIHVHTLRAIQNAITVIFQFLDGAEEKE
ncbi:MAG: hypothetical protein Q7S52_00435 [bacterium]|nr:hypothetical protein [bacterium]